MEDLLQVGVITQTHGIRGEVKVFPTTDDANRFRKLKETILDTAGKNLEEKIRDWAVADSAIIIICGPIIDKPSKTIGKNKVAVPERFFKVILSPFVKPARGIGFLFNNRQAVEPLSTYAVSIDSIEKLTHMDFFSPLPDEIENAVEANADYYQWPR